MRKLIPALIACVISGTVSMAQPYRVTLRSNHHAGIAYLTYHLGPRLSIEDSAIVDNSGKAVFTGNRKLPGGIYAIVFPGKRNSADFLIDKSQVIDIQADTSNLAAMKVTGSPENILFQQYQRDIQEKGNLLMAERNAYMASRTAKDSALHEAKYNQYNKDLNDYRQSLIVNHPNSMMAALLQAMKEPPVPPHTAVTRQDSLDNYYYYKSHFWDGVSFMDDRIIRTPFFLPKLERYYRDVLAGAPADSLIKDIDYKLLLARTAPETYKFLLNWLTDEYINPKYMGQDAVFVHLFQQYHSKGLSPWLNAKQMEVISRRAYMQMDNLIGVQAANLEMLDTAGKPTPLYGVKADYILVLFWDPTCGHCKEELPKIDSIYRASWQKKNVKIYAVLTEDKKTEWLSYINEHNLRDWINVYQTKEMEKADYDAQRPGYRQLYDVIQTPTVVLLDKEKRIIGKKLSWQQLNDFLESKWTKKTN